MTIFGALFAEEQAQCKKQERIRAQRIALFMRDYAPRLERRARFIDRLGDALAILLVASIIAWAVL